MYLEARHGEYFSPMTRNAVIVMSIAGCLSCLMVSALIAHILYVIVGPVFTRSATQKAEGERSFFRKQLGVFILCLFLSDFVQSFSGMINIRWATRNGVSRGVPCTVQGIALMAGDLGTTFWNAVVAVHTFMTIVLQRWSFVLLFSVWKDLPPTSLTSMYEAALGPLAIQNAQHGPFYGIADNWCFITNEYASARVWLHYVPMLLSGFIIFVLYTLVFLVLRGNLVVQNSHFTLRRRKTAKAMEDLPDPAATAVAKKLLWYPISYVFLVLPIAVARLVELVHYEPKAARNVGITILYLSGFVNTIIYTATRRALAPIHWPQARAIFASRVSRVLPSRRRKVDEEDDTPPTSSKLSGFFAPPGTDDAVWVTTHEETEYSYPVELSTGTIDDECSAVSRPEEAHTKHKHPSFLP